MEAKPGRMGNNAAMAMTIKSPEDIERMRVAKSD